MRRCLRTLSAEFRICLHFFFMLILFFYDYCYCYYCYAIVARIIKLKRCPVALLEPHYMRVAWPQRDSSITFWFPLPRRSKQWARPESFVIDVRAVWCRIDRSLLNYFNLVGPFVWHPFTHKWFCIGGKALTTNGTTTTTHASERLYRGVAASLVWSVRRLYLSS